MELLSIRTVVSIACVSERNRIDNRTIPHENEAKHRTCGNQPQNPPHPCGVPPVKLRYLGSGEPQREVRLKHRISG